MDIVTAVITGAASAAFISGIFSIIMWALSRKASLKDRDGDIIMGLQLLYYDRIKHLCMSYTEAGEIDSGDLEDLIKMHKVYQKNLHGNGFLDCRMKVVKALPVVCS